MHLNKLREEIVADEGRIESIYLDHLGFPTVGIGHLIRKEDLEHGLPVGTPVPASRVDELFAQDIQIVISDVSVLFPDFFQFPEEVQHIIANMVFQMGRTRLSGFKNFRAAVSEGDWKKAALEMKDSKWYTQTTNRAERLIERMKAVA